MLIIITENDRVVLSVASEFKVSLTADGESLDKYPWRVLDVSVYVGEESDGAVVLPPPIQAFLKELLANRLPVAAQPLAEIYSVLRTARRNFAALTFWRRFFLSFSQTRAALVSNGEPRARSLAGRAVAALC